MSGNSSNLLLLFLNDMLSIVNTVKIFQNFEQLLYICSEIELKYLSEIWNKLYSVSTKKYKTTVY